MDIEITNNDKLVIREINPDLGECLATYLIPLLSTLHNSVKNIKILYPTKTWLISC